MTTPTTTNTAALEVVALIVRDVCETDPADPSRPETVCIRVDDLQRIAEERIATLTQQQGGEQARLKRALAEYPHRNTRQLQARKVCEGVLALAASDVDLPPPLPTPIDPGLAKVVAFLLGEASLEGVWFGEKHPSGQPYWWRNNLRDATRGPKP